MNAAATEREENLSERVRRLNGTLTTGAVPSRQPHALTTHQRLVQEEYRSRLRNADGSATTALVGACDRLIRIERFMESVFPRLAEEDRARGNALLTE